MENVIEFLFFFLYIFDFMVLCEASSFAKCVDYGCAVKRATAHQILTRSKEIQSKAKQII